MTRLSFGGSSFETSNEDKLLFPDCGVTKGDLIGYYRKIAPVMLPHLQGRPLTLHRFPDGIEAEGFYQQNRSEHFPDWVDAHSAPRAAGGGKGPIEHVVCNNGATLAYLANQATITFHRWLASVSKLGSPDLLVFDLDPPGDDFDPVRAAARRLVELLDPLGLRPFVMTTGSRGLHVLSPIEPDLEFDEVRAFARAVAEHLARHHPEALTVEQRKQARRGRLYLDVMRNAYGQTGVAPYSVRALPGAPVATPITLDELDDARLQPQRWRLDNILRRLGQRDDPWRTIQQHRGSVPRARDTLQRLL